MIVKSLLPKYSQIKAYNFVMNLTGRFSSKCIARCNDAIFSEIRNIMRYQPPTFPNKAFELAFTTSN